MNDGQVIHPMIAFKRDLEAMVMGELTMLDDTARARMKNAAVVAVTKDPELLGADRQSFMMAIRMCASHGVIPDGNEAVLQVYNTKIKRPDGKEDWVKKVTYLPMVRGIINRVQRSGKIRIFYAEIVCDGEEFRLDLSRGDRRPLHEFDPMRRSANIIGAYSVATYDDGTVDTEPMPRAEIDKVRNVAKTKNVWDGWFGEKAKVAVMKRHAKRLPLSAEDMDFIINREETDFSLAKDVTPKKSGFQRMAAQARGQIDKPADEGGAGVVEITGDAAEVMTLNYTMDNEHFAAGNAAGLDEASSRGDCIELKDPDAIRAWMAGFDGARGIE